ncbi:hypothetical protein STRAU_5681 [Streptomyces aurantiacus JA 4570]|uniref:Uncharacterized protein n=1 Tax=Streptomyces aurantiacus JA 4570 TaxID=1286094 RepID=S3ZC26_9ACTN|nr:hypothetical protein STRAU_5681 [Streptomyces aurantiacus JA 4570]
MTRRARPAPADCHTPPAVAARWRGCHHHSAGPAQPPAGYRMNCDFTKADGMRALPTTGDREAPR